MASSKRSLTSLSRSMASFLIDLRAPSSMVVVKVFLSMCLKYHKFIIYQGDKIMKIIS